MTCHTCVRLEKKLQVEYNDGVLPLATDAEHAVS